MTDAVNALSDEVANQLGRLRDGDPVPPLPPTHRRPLRELLRSKPRDPGDADLEEDLDRYDRR